jgi:DNA-binding LacI/PurR family transcriptional regulator
MRTRGRPTIKDVARRAGVSSATVSYVISGPKASAARISDETTNRILEVVRELGYVPNQSARTLRLQRTNRVLFLGSRLTSLFSQAMALSIEQELEKHGLALAVQVGTGGDAIQRAIDILEQGQADGLIAETSSEFVPELSAAAARGHAIVAIGPNQSDVAFDVLSIEVAPAVVYAMNHVHERGYRHFLLLSSQPEVLEDYRTAVARQTLLDLGVGQNDITVKYCPHDRILAHEAALELIPNLPRPLAIAAGSDVSAIGVLWACIRLEISVPDDVAIIGHGNTPETHVTVPTLTSIGPVEADFRQAAELMASRLIDRSLVGRQVTMPCELTIRDSSGPGARP